MGLSGILINSLHHLSEIETESRAYFLAQDAIEAAKNIRDRDWDEVENLETNTVYHPERVSDAWVMESGLESVDNYSREVIFDNVLRDGEGNIVLSGGTADPLMRKVTARVCWGGIMGASLEFTGGATVSDLTNFPSNSGWGDPGQSFTTGPADVSVKRVSLYLGKLASEPSDIYLEIRSDSTVGTVLGTSATINSANLPQGELTWQDFTFFSPVNLAPGTKYFLRLRSIPDSTIPWSGAQGPIYWGYIQTAYSPPGYADGEAWRYIGQDENPGYGGVELGQYDFSFRIHESDCQSGQMKSVVLANYLTHWQYSYNFVHYITQTNQSDFERSIFQDNIDTASSPGNVLLARTLMHLEDFETYGGGADPTDWVDTEANFSLTENQNLFKTDDRGEDSMVFGTTSTSNHIHSHYNGAGALNWESYEVKGKMMFTDDRGGMGITFTSRYPSADKYFYLHSEYEVEHDDYFGIGSRNTSLTAEGVDDRNTEVLAEEGVWYWFRIRVREVSDQSLIVAKVWKDTEDEPLSWQIDCFSEEASRPVTGTIGFWTEGNGEKYFDNIEVRDLTSYFASGTLESAHFDTGAESVFGELFWVVDNPEDTAVKFQLRSAKTEAALGSATWYGPASESDYYESALGQEVVNSVHRYDRWIQYKAYLSTDDLTVSPSFQEISISYDHRHE